MPYRKVLEGLTAAVRSGSREQLRDDLLEMVVEGAEQWRRDDRDLQVALAPYHCGAVRIGVDPAALFAEVAGRLPADLAPIVRRFGARTDVSPAAFGFFVEQTPEGPSYEFEASSDNDVEDLLRKLRGGTSTD